MTPSPQATDALQKQLDQLQQSLTLEQQRSASLERQCRQHQTTNAELQKRLQTSVLEQVLEASEAHSQQMDRAREVTQHLQDQLELAQERIDEMQLTHSKALYAAREREQDLIAQLKQQQRQLDRSPCCHCNSDSGSGDFSSRNRRSGNLNDEHHKEAEFREVLRQRNSLLKQVGEMQQNHDAIMKQLKEQLKALLFRSGASADSAVAIFAATIADDQHQLQTLREQLMSRDNEILTLREQARLTEQRLQRYIHSAEYSQQFSTLIPMDSSTNSSMHSSGTNSTQSTHRNMPEDVASLSEYSEGMHGRSGEEERGAHCGIDSELLSQQMRLLLLHRRSEADELEEELLEAKARICELELELEQSKTGSKTNGSNRSRPVSGSFASPMWL
eukprot:TRINITY_DN8603_c0_g1_i2.p1 TRINITY_DN8603_c0_g1~~TRINITY_DN8603_c0_g1_i2.p1  ORF type:complete len:389 (-),score=92.28 TRINITY_DN8603_c0_g1_i2:52-1218(-)